MAIPDSKGMYLMTMTRARYFAIFVWLLFITAVVFLKVERSEAGTEEDYQDLVTASYDFRFGKDKPFAPGNATTFNGKFIKASDFTSSSRCASCHTDVHPQWAESAHAKGSPKDAIGAVVFVTTGKLRQRVDVTSGAGYASQNHQIAHFGLGKAVTVDELKIMWPAGQTEIFKAPKVNTLITVEQGKGIVEK